MFDGQIVIETGTAYDILSPWFPRGGNKMVATIETVSLMGGQITVNLLTKEGEAKGDGGAPTASNAITSSGNAGGTASDEFSGLDDLVRYKFTVSAGSAGDWIMFRMLTPVWSEATS